MNCSPTIAMALLLLSLTGGMFLLYKTQKENLNAFFKVVAWFIIVVSFCSMICCAMRCIMRGCLQREECREMEGCERYGGMNKHMMMYRGEDEGGCEMMEGRGCCKGKMECSEEEEECEESGQAGKKCCDKDPKKCEMKMDMKKDSVTAILKKK